MGMQSRVLRNIDFFSRIDIALLDCLIEQLMPRKVEMAEIVYKRYEQAGESTFLARSPLVVYFIARGKIDFYLETRRLVYKTMMEGSYFGDYEVIFHISRLHTTRARVDSDILCLSKKARRLL